MDQLVSQFQTLTLDEKRCFFQALEIKPRGWLYAYRIPVFDVQVTVMRKDRSGETRFKYASRQGEWCLVNMGMTLKPRLRERLNYLHCFFKDIKPDVQFKGTGAEGADCMYAIEADIGYEQNLRKACFLGGWDPGKYYSTAGAWSQFLMQTPRSIGATECVVIPSAAFARIQKHVQETFVYPLMQDLVVAIKRIVMEETLALLTRVDSEALKVLERDAVSEMCIVVDEKCSTKHVKRNPFDALLLNDSHLNYK